MYCFRCTPSRLQYSICDACCEQRAIAIVRLVQCLKLSSAPALNLIRLHAQNQRPVIPAPDSHLQQAAEPRRQLTDYSGNDLNVAMHHQSNECNQELLALTMRGQKTRQAGDKEKAALTERASSSIRCPRRAISQTWAGRIAHAVASAFHSKYFTFTNSRSCTFGFCPIASPQAHLAPGTAVEFAAGSGVAAKRRMPGLRRILKGMHGPALHVTS